MENNKTYAIQDIENIKQKIAEYRETLTTLKRGASIEELLNMAQKFDGLKKQAVHFENLTETTKTQDAKPSVPIGEYEEKVKQISIQIDSLNQTVEDMNREFSPILKKLQLNNDPTSIDNKIEPTNSNISSQDINPLFKLTEGIPQNTEPPLLTNQTPSYQLLQSIAGIAKSPKRDEYKETTVAHNEPLDHPLEGQHFNHQYFQSTNTHPSHIHNALFRNASMTAAFHFKDKFSIKESPTDMYERLENPPISSTDEPENTVSTTEEYHEVQLESSIVERIAPIESSSAPKPAETKKDGFSSFFNFFKRKQ